MARFQECSRLTTHYPSQPAMVPFALTSSSPARKALFHSLWLSPVIGVFRIAFSRNYSTLTTILISPIEANIRLSSASGQGGAFDVSASSSNSHLELKFPESPVDSNLDLDASTSNGRASVNLNPAYEGSFVLRTSSFSSIVLDDTRKVEDPSGKDRTRVVVVNERSRGSVAGSVRWDQNPQKHYGKVSVKTSNGPVYLAL